MSSLVIITGVKHDALWHEDSYEQYQVLQCCKRENNNLKTVAFERYSMDKANMHNNHRLTLACSVYCEEIKIIEECLSSPALLPTDAASLCLKKVGSATRGLWHGLARLQCT